MKKKLTKRLISLILTGGILLSSTGVYTALAASEELTTSEYTSALVGSEETVTDVPETTVPSTSESTTSETTEAETTEKETEKETETTTVLAEKPATTVKDETTTLPPFVDEKEEEFVTEETEDNKAGEWVGVDGTTANMGTQDNPYAVSSVELFLRMNEIINDTGNSNKYFRFTQDIDFSATEINQSLLDDLAVDGGVGGSLVSINPELSNNSNVFFELDGNGKKIQNVTMSLDSFNSLSIFGYVNSASYITNLTVTDTSITNGYSDSQAAGIILKNEGTVKDCSFTKIILDTTASTTKAESFYPDNTNLRTYSGTAIVVDNSGSIDSETNYDRNEILVTAENVKVSTSRPYAGVMVAQNRGKLNKIRARYITVTGHVVKSEYVGGLVGANMTQRTSSATGMYYCEIQKHASAGGVRGADKVGYLVGYNTGRIQRAKVEGNFKSSQQATSSKYDILVTGATTAGGIAGDNTGDIQLCNAIDIGVYFADATDGAIYGGIAGKSTYGIRNCIATGSTAGAGVAEDTIRYIGGIVGCGDSNANFSVENCYALVKIIDSEAVLGAIVGWGGDEAYRNNKIRNVFYSSIISSRPSPVSFGGAGANEGDLVFTKPYAVAFYDKYGASNTVSVSASDFGFSGWGEASFSVTGNFTGVENPSYYMLTGLGTNSIRYQLSDTGKADKTVVSYGVDITIPSSVGANKDGTTLVAEPMEFGILNSSGFSATGDGSKGNPIPLVDGDINFLYYAPAAHFTISDTLLSVGGLVATADKYTAPAATFWGTLDFKGAQLQIECDKPLFKGIYGSRDDSLTNNTSSTHKSDSSDEADVETNLANGVIKNLVVKLYNTSGGTRSISSVFGNICNATVKNTSITFSNALTIVPTEGDTGLFAKAVYGNTYMYGCYVDSEYNNGKATTAIKSSYDCVSGFIGVIDADKAIIDNCGADIVVEANKSGLNHNAVFVGRIKALNGGYIQNCYATGGLIRSGGSFTNSNYLFASDIQSHSSATNIYNCYYSPSYLYNDASAEGVTAGIKSGSFTGSCKVWSFQMQNTATQEWGDITLKVSAATDILYLETINNIDRFALNIYSDAANNLSNYFTAVSSNDTTLSSSAIRWYGRIGVSTTFSGGKNASASMTVKHDATGLTAKITVFNSSDLEIDADNYYLIKSPVDLYYLSTNQTKLVQGSTEYMYISKNSKIKLAADIDMSGHVIDPIGSSSNFFKGEFVAGKDENGEYYTISNLTLNGNTYHGLFGHVQGATIKGIHLDNANVVSGSYTAALVGRVYDYAVIEDCKVTNSNITGENHVGAIVGGINEKDDTTGSQKTEIRNCTVESTTITSTKTSEHAYIGAIVGGIGVKQTDTRYAEIEGCNVTDCTLSANAYGIGGVVGYAPNNSNTITSCNVTGTNLTCTGTNGVTYASLGGVAGLFGGSSLANCTVTDTTVTGECASGVVGRLINESGTSTISGCTVTNSVITAPDIAGGILAQVSAFAVNSCYGDKVVTGCKISADTTVTAPVAGGMVGNVQQFSNKNLTISSCTNLGTIETTGKKGSITDAAGGIVGRLQSGLETAGIRITGCLSAGKLKGDSNLGGIIGMNNANAHTGDDKLIKDCYVTSAFTSKNLAVVKGLAIGFVGYLTKNNSSAFAENVVFSSLNNREALFGNIAEQSGGFDMNKGADQTRGITVDAATTAAARLPYILESIVDYKDGTLGTSNVIELKTNYYVGNGDFDWIGTLLSHDYDGKTYTLPSQRPASAITASTQPCFKVGNLPAIKGTDGKNFTAPSDNPFSTSASSSKILVGCSTSTGTTNATYNKLTSVGIQTFDKKCNATVKTTYSGIINGETVSFDVGFTVIVNGEHAYDGEGTRENPFLIYNAEDLISIKQHHDNPSAKDDYKDNPAYYYEACYMVMNDIDMKEELETNSKSFAPIGTEDEPFKGVILTQNDLQFKISNLLIDNPEKSEDYAYYTYFEKTDADGNKEVVYSDALGIFGYTDGAEISNLELENVQITSVPGEAKDGVLGSVGFLGTKTGALVGSAKNTTIKNVKVTGTSKIEVNGSYGGRAGAIGGIVGMAGNDVVLNGVSVVGTSNENRTEIIGMYQVGGIVGSSADATGCSITSPIIENVNVTNVATSGVSIAGGIAGQYAGTITSGTVEEVRVEEVPKVDPETGDILYHPGTDEMLTEKQYVTVEVEQRTKVNNVSVTGIVVGGVVGSGNIINLVAGGRDLTIEKLDVTNTVVKVTDSVMNDANASSNGIAGGILGQSLDSYHYYITDCIIDNNSSVTSGYCAGGIVGSASNRGDGQLQTETCLIISDCSTQAKVNQLKAPTTNTLSLSDTIKRKTGAGSVIGVITSNANVMNKDTFAPQIQIKNITAGGEVTGTFNVGGVIGEFASFQGKLNQLTESLIYDCIVTAKITALEAATERFGVILGSVEGNQHNSNNPNEQVLNVQAPFPEQDSHGSTVIYDTKPFDKIFYSSYTAGSYNLYGLSAIKDYQDPVYSVFFSTIYDVNKVMYNFETDDGTVQLPVSVVKDGFVADNPTASYQYFDVREYNFSTEFAELLAANDGTGDPFGFTIAGKEFTLTTDGDQITGVHSSNEEVFKVINNPNYVQGSTILGQRQFKIEVVKFDTADLVFTYTNGLQIGIPVICGVNFEGEGTAENPIQVSNADIFYHIVKVLPGYSFIQTADIDLSDAKKYPATMTSQLIANFTGTYDGQGHKIIGFDVNIESSESPVGIFSKVSGVKNDADGNVIPNVQNVTFVDCSVDGGSTSAGTGIFAGEITNGATVSNIKVISGEKNSSSATSKLGNVGGAIGTVTGASIVDGVTVEGTTVETEKGSAGGAVGTVVEDTAKIISPIVKNTTVTSGDVDADGTFLGGNSFEDIAGGIVAQANGTITGPEAVIDEETGETVYPNAVENVKVNALVAGGAVGAVYKTNIADATPTERTLTLKDIKVSSTDEVSGTEITAKDKGGTRATSGAGLLGWARAITNVTINNCYVNNTTKTSSVASVGGVSYGAGAVAQVDNTITKLTITDTESYAEINAQEAKNDGVVYAASLVAYIDNAPEILSFDGCVAGGKITGKAMKTFVGGVIGGFTDAFASNEITHEIFINGVISAELECVDGESNNQTLKAVHKKGKFIAGYADGMFTEANFSTMFANNYYSTYPDDIAFFATESGDKGPLDALLAQVENGFTNINVQENLAIADEFKSGWNSVAITKSIGSETTLYARLSEKYAALPYGSEANRRNAVAAGGFSLKETAKDAEGKPISCIDLVGEPSQTENIGEFELVVKPTDYGAEMLVAEYTCGLKTTAQIISVEIEGEGNEASPFLISTPTQLRVVAYLTVGNYHFRQVNDIDLSDSYATNGTDTDKFIHNNGGRFYAPIGTETSPFDGVYDGQGYKITGVKADRRNENNVGVFGVIAQNGTLVPVVKNLHVELMPTDKVKANGILGNENVGGIAGKISNAIIENCSVTVGSVTGNKNVGGIVGHFTSSRIINCFTQSDVNAFGEKSQGVLSINAGGIVGYVFHAFNFNSTISGCFASGSIYATPSSSGSNDASNAAGIVSYLENSTDLVIDNCLFTGTTASGYGIVGSNGQMNFVMTISDCIDAGQNIATNSDSFRMIPSAVASATTHNTGTITKSNIYYDNALLKVDTNNRPDTDYVKGMPTSELVDTTSVSMGDGWTVDAGYYPVPVVSEITVTTYDENYAITGTETKVDPYSYAYAKFLSAPMQTSEEEESNDINDVLAYGKGLVYPVTLLTNIDGNKVTYSSSIFDTTDTVAYPEGFDTKLYGVRTEGVDAEGNPIVVNNKNVDLLFEDKVDENGAEYTSVYRNIFDTTKGIATRGGFETIPEKNTYVVTGAVSGNVFSNGEAYYNAQVPVIFAEAEIGGVKVQRDIKVPLNYETLSGTTFCIATQRQLYALGKAEYELVTGTKFSNYYNHSYNYNLITDIDCGDNETLFTPIGLDVSSGYTGQFNGNGHKIINLKIEQTGKDYVGMFSKISKDWNNGSADPFVKDLTLENATVVATGVTSGNVTTGGNYVGTLVGYIMGSGDIVIENCHAIGHVEYDEEGKILPETIVGTVSGNGSYVGGLIGKVDFPTTVIRSCSSSVMVSGSKDAVGGLIGETGATITSCYATGNVVCDKLTTGNTCGVGGLIGIMTNGTVNQSFASGNVEVERFDNGNNKNLLASGEFGIGGFVGLVKDIADAAGDVITECFSGGNVAFGNENNLSAIKPSPSTVIGIGGFSGINYEGIAHAYSSAAVEATFGEIFVKDGSSSTYGIGIGGVSGVALGNVEDIYSSGSVAPAYTSITEKSGCYFGVGGTVGTKMGSDATVRYCYYDSWTNTDPDLTSIGGQANSQEARSLTTLELTSGKKPANTNFSDVWGFTPSAYPYLKTLLNEESDNYIKTNSILSVVCVNVAADDVSAKTGAGITQALTVPSVFMYQDDKGDTITYNLDWAGATLSGNLASVTRTRNVRETVDVVAQVRGLEEYATRVYKRLCADMKGTFKQPYLIGSEEDLNHVNMTEDELNTAKADYKGFYDQWATPLGEGNEQIEGTVHYQLMSNIEVDSTVRNIPEAPDSYTYTISSTDDNGNATTTDKDFAYKGFMLKGNGYSIKGVEKNSVNVSGNYISKVDEYSTISNIIFENFAFTGSGSAIVGTNAGLLQDIFVKSTMGDGTTGISDVAGLVNTNEKPDKQMVYIDIDDDNKEKPVCDNKGNPVMCGTIDGCLVDATIKGALSNVGVMAITNDGTIVNSGTAGTLDTFTGDSVSDIGAFVVSNNGTIGDSFSMADVNVLTDANANVQNVSGFAATNAGTINGVYTRSAVSFENEPAATLTVGSLVGTITSTEEEPVTNAYAAGLLGYFNEAQDSILFGTVPSGMNKLSSVYVDKSLAGKESADSFKYSASLSSIMELKYMADTMEYVPDNPETTDVNEENSGSFIAGDKEALILPQLAAILNAENHQVVDESGNLIYVHSETGLTYTIYTETINDEETGETITRRRYRCSDGNIYFADDIGNVLDENQDVLISVEDLELQYAIYLADRTVIRNYDVLKAYSKMSSMTIKTAQSIYADRLVPNSSSSADYGISFDSKISDVDGVLFNPVSDKDIVGINNSSKLLSTKQTDGAETIRVNNRNKIKLSRGMEIDPTLYIDVAVDGETLINSINPNFAGGVGTKEKPYVIGGDNNDVSVSSLQSLHYYGTESELYFVLGNDIDMNPELEENKNKGVDDFQIHYFTAHLNDLSENAQGTHQYTIENFTSTNGHGGLFGTIESGAVVNNVALTGTVEGKEPFTGALANIINDAKVTNCVISADVTAGEGASATGLLAGRVTGLTAGDNVEKTVISGIVTTGNVNAETGVVGGVIGSAQRAEMSNFLSTANVKTVENGVTSAGIVGQMVADTGETTTLTNVLYGGFAEGYKVADDKYVIYPIVAITSGSATVDNKAYFDNQINGKELADGIIGTGKSTRDCEKETFGDEFSVVDSNGGYYCVPADIVNTIGLDGGETIYESYGSTAALAAVSLNFYLGSGVGYPKQYTSLRFEPYASGTLIDVSEVPTLGEDGEQIKDEKGNPIEFFRITTETDESYTPPKPTKVILNCLKYNDKDNPQVLLELGNGAKRTIYPGLVKTANVSYKVIANNEIVYDDLNGKTIYDDVNGKMLGLLLKSAKDGDKINVLNDFTKEVNEETDAGKLLVLDSFIVDDEEMGFYMSDMLPKGYKYKVNKIMLNPEFEDGKIVENTGSDITENAKDDGSDIFVNLNFDNATGNAKNYEEFNLGIVLEIVRDEKPWGVNSIINTLWN